VKCARAQLSLGAYVLGALGRRESRRITTHVATCDACRTELTELARLRPMLEQLSLEQLSLEQLSPDEFDTELELAPHPRVLHRLLRRVAIERTQRTAAGQPRVRLVFAACLLLAAVVAGGVVTLVAVWPSAPAASVAAQAEPSSVTVTDPATNVVVDAMLTPRPAGTDITVSLTGGTPGEWCWLVAVAQDGRMQQFASWQVTARGDVKVSASTEIKRSDLTEIRVVRDDQSLLANLNVG
jgi:Putative zinc-finger